jgi:hypothetical protein
MNLNARLSSRLDLMLNNAKIETAITENNGKNTSQLHFHVYKNLTTSQQGKQYRHNHLYIGQYHHVLLRITK